MMTTELLLPILVLALVILGVQLVKLARTRSGYDPGPLLDGAVKLVAAADSLAKRLDRNPGKESVTEALIRHADTAVRAAEQMYKSGQLPEDQRKAKAVEIVKGLLGIDFNLDDDQYSFIENLIDAAIEAAVNWMPKHPFNSAALKHTAPSMTAG